MHNKHSKGKTILRFLEIMNKEQDALERPLKKDLVSLAVAVGTYFAVAIITNFSRLEIEAADPLKDFKGFKE